MTELGVGYLSIVADTSKIPGQVNSALGNAQRSADGAGKSMGSGLAAGIRKSFVIDVGPAISKATGVMTSTITKGLGRLSSIDDAQGKLTSLGHNAASTAKIMDSALASMKGTSYGLGDAASIAASAVAAGVQPGKDLTRYLGLTADAASIAGVSLQEMGQIINKVQTSGTAYTMEITQLADRGLPIWQWLADEMKKPQAEMKKLVAEGKVDSATYLRAIENNIGGAATAATTVSSAWANLGAAQGRFGATIAGPIFRQAIPAFTALTKSVDDLDARAKPVMAQFESNLTGKYIPALKDFGTEASSAFQQFRSSDLVQGSMFRLGSVFEQVSSTAKEVAPAVGSIVKSLAIASGALGLSTWEIFLSTLEGTARVLDVTLVPVLNTTASLMENHQGLVIAAAGAWMAFKTIPSIVSRVGTAIQPLTSRIDSARTSLRGFGDTMKLQQQLATASGQSIGRVGAAMGALGSHVPVIGKMQMAYRGAADSASHFARTQGVAAGAMSGLKSAGSSLAGFLGGPWGIAFAAATIGILNYQKGVANAANQNRILADSAQASATAQSELLKSMASGDDVGIASQVLANVRDLRREQQSLADTSPSLMQKSAAGWDALGSAIGITRGETFKSVEAQQKVAESATAVTDTLDSLKISNEELGRAVSGSAADHEKLRTQLVASGPDGETAARWLKEQREEYLKLQDAMKRVGPAGVEVMEGLKEIGNAGADSKKKVEGLERVLRGLGILETDAQAALFSTAEAVREIAEAAAKGADPIGGLGQALIGLDGNLDPDKSNAKLLRESLIGLGDEFKNLTVSGMMGAEAFDKIKPGLQSLADMYDLPIEKVAELARQYKIVPDVVDTALVVDGSTAAYQAITGLKLLLDELPTDAPQVVNMFVEDAQARKALEDAGNKVELLDGKSGEIRVTAKTESFDAGVEIVAKAMSEIGAKVVSPKVMADTATFRIEDENVRRDLQSLREQVADPKVVAIIDKFIEGRDVTLKELNDIDSKTAKPDVELLTGKVLSQVEVAREALDTLAKPRWATVYVTAQTYGAFSREAFAAAGADMSQWRDGPGRASGGRLPTSGPGTDRTDGFLGVAANGMPIARVDAGEWVINSRNSEKYNRELAMINAGVFPKLPGFATGGVVGNSDLHALVEGRVGGANGPLRGARYDFAGINWGDCSAAMSAIARFAVGLAPFAARFATGNMREALAALGFLPGRGGPGDLRFGWYNGGPWGGHTAGTFPDGTNVEMGGAYGGGMVDGTTGSNSPEFTDHAYLPIASEGGRTTSSRSTSTRKRPEWTDKQQLDLENAEIEVRKAEEARSKVEAELAKGKKSQTDLDSANKKIQLAQQKVLDLQKKKDDVANWVEDGPVPQAPALSRAFTDAEIERIDAQLAVQSANDRRNEVYDDPDSTENEIAKADAELFKAEKALRELGSQKPGDGPKSWSEMAGDAAKSAVSGHVSDILGVFGIPDELPPAMQAWQMFEKAQAEQNPYLLEPSAEERAAGAQVGPAGAGMAPWSQIAGDSPVLYDAQRGIAQWGDHVADGLNQIGGPGAAAAAALRAELDKFRGAPRFWGGGFVDGPPGVDKVPAWLTGKEFVVNALDANAGANPAILQAINSGVQFAVGKPQQPQQPPVDKPGGGESWRPAVQITNQITVSNEQSQMRKLHESNERLLMQYGGAK